MCYQCFLVINFCFQSEVKILKIAKMYGVGVETGNDSIALANHSTKCSVYIQRET